ncbi:MAG TPA: DNA polymerase III subunit beta [Streptosporangiaceae bacterium]|nr:DNA polymerase III subunit beta [Streptosporangiaceae bacterium]
MKIQVERDALADAVAWTARALPARPALPVLAGMRLAASGSELSLSSFDYDLSAQASIEVSCEEEGTVLVPGRLLAEITRSLPARPVEISTDGARVVVVCGSATFTLLPMPTEDYPSLPPMPPAAGSVGSDAFASAVAQSATAASRDDTIPGLTGVRMEIEGDTLTLVSTDRYRLAVRELPWNPARPGLSASVLVPARAMLDTARSLTSGAEVLIALALPGEGDQGGEGMIGFEGAGRRTTTRLLGGEFPPYRSLLPDHATAVGELATAPFSEAVKRVALVATHNTALRVSFSPGQAVLEAGTGDEAQAVEALEASYEFLGYAEGEQPAHADSPESTFGPDGLEAAFNPTFLLDGLAAIDSDTARMAFTKPGRAVLITGKPGPGGVSDYRYLLMPIRLGT